jgi:hypothetical protein
MLVYSTFKRYREGKRSDADRASKGQRDEKRA